MLVETGNFMADDRAAHGYLRSDAAAKDDWILKAYRELGVDVVNVSSHDLRYFSQVSKRSPNEPLLNRLVSANIGSESPVAQTLRPYIIRDILPRRVKTAKRIRVALIGLTETDPPPPTGFKIADPAEAARPKAIEAKQKADVVIVLAKVSTQEAARIAREAPNVDVIIDGNGETFTPPVYVGRTLIVFTPFETRMLGELRFYRNPAGQFSTWQRFIALDEAAIPEDAAIKEFVDAANNAEIQARNNSKGLLSQWLLSGKGQTRDKTEQSESSGYVSSAACNKCHVAQYMKWLNGPHARTANSLLLRGAEFEVSCLDCHASGAKADIGSRTQNIECEQCHGPGRDHVAKPGKGYGRVSNIQTACASCHTNETSPGFDVQTAWAKIRH